MPEPIQSLIRYNDESCEYSLFISYAHLDDKSNNYWITSVKDAFFERMGQLPNGIPKKQIHFSGEDPLISGTLGTGLENRLARSFAMLLVVGKKYLESAYCEQELKLFKMCFPNGHKSRLFIAVMGENYLFDVQKGETWKQIVAPDQIYVSMYSENNKNIPLEHRIDGSKGYPPEFRKAAYGLADRWLKEIESDWTKSTEDSGRRSDSEVLRVGSIFSTGAGATHALRVAIGPFTGTFLENESSGPVKLLQQTLEQAGAQVSFIPADILMEYTRVSGEPVKSELAKIDVLVLPLLDEAPLLPDYAGGGHATLLLDEWKKLGKATRHLIWYRPAISNVRPAKTPEARHQEVFKSLAPVCTSPQAVVNLLFGAGTSDVIKIYVEKHPQITVYSLKNAIEKAWGSLPISSDGRRPNLRCIPLMLDRLDEVPKDVAAIVLLDAAGHSAKKSLRARESEVEKCFPKDESIYPGLVAVVFSPSLPVSMLHHDWPDVTFERTDGTPPALELESNSTWLLNDFLSDILNQHLKNR